MPSFNFDDQLHVGAWGEDIIDKFFSRWYVVRKVSREMQRQGIDRILVSKRDNSQLKVEYKTDTKAHQTGNVFVETVSVDAAQKRGWVYTSKADVLAYWIPGRSVIYTIHFSTLREVFPHWEWRHRHVTAANDHYATHGILVPLVEFAQCGTANALYAPPDAKFRF
jgi:hypothetical protein